MWISDRFLRCWIPMNTGGDGCVVPCWAWSWRWRVPSHSRRWLTPVRRRLWPVAAARRASRNGVLPAEGPSACWRTLSFRRWRCRPTPTATPWSSAVCTTSPSPGNGEVGRYCWRLSRALPFRVRRSGRGCGPPLRGRGGARRGEPRCAVPDAGVPEPGLSEPSLGARTARRGRRPQARSRPGPGRRCRR